tara:strand:+ start:132 stop:680 length:549 start_codon:yes stop_codon:yes gene_type:complete
MSTLTLGGSTLANKTGSVVSINDGVILPAGTVLQVQTTINTTLNVLSASTNERDTGISVSLTPKISGSKILIMADLSTSVNGATGLGLFIKRTGPSTTNLQVGSSGTHPYGKAFYYSGLSTQDSAVWSATGNFTDTAQDASTAHVYTIYIKTNNSYAVGINRREGDTFWGSTTSIIAMEIKA